MALPQIKHNGLGYCITPLEKINTELLRKYIEKNAVVVPQSFD